MLEKDTLSYYAFPANTAKPKVSKRLSAIDRFILEQYEKGYFDLIDRWAIEYDPIEQTVKREIGYDFSGKIIFTAPTRRSYGFWSDTNIPIEAYLKFGAEKIQADTFHQDFRTGGDD